MFLWNGPESPFLREDNGLEAGSTKLNVLVEPAGEPVLENGEFHKNSMFLWNGPESPFLRENNKPKINIKHSQKRTQEQT